MLFFQGIKSAGLPCMRARRKQLYPDTYIYLDYFVTQFDPFVILKSLLRALIHLVIRHIFVGAFFPGGKRGAGFPGTRAGGERLDAVEVRGPMQEGTERHLQTDRGARWRGDGEAHFTHCIICCSPEVPWYCTQGTVRPQLPKVSMTVAVFGVSGMKNPAAIGTSTRAV